MNDYLFGICLVVHQTWSPTFESYMIYEKTVKIKAIIIAANDELLAPTPVVQAVMRRFPFLYALISHIIYICLLCISKITKYGYL